LDLGADKLNFAGSIGYGRDPRLRMQIKSQGGAVAGWSRFLPMPAFEAVAGKADLDVTLTKNLSDAGAQPSLTGGLKLSDATFKHKASGRSIENLQAAILFDGTKARLENGRFRLGHSFFFLNGTTANVFEPRLISTIRSPALLSADLPMLSPSASVRLKDVLGQAEIFFENDQWVLTGSLAAPEGDLNDWPLRDLRADIALAPAGLTFKNLRARILKGLLRADGFWPATGEHERQVQFSSQIEAIDMGALLAQIFPPLKDRIEGQLNGHGQFEIDDLEGPSARGGLKGSGEASLQRGTIKNFNLVRQLLMKGSGTAVSAAAMSRVPPGFAALFKRPDTPIDSLNANFTIEEKRVFTEDLVITTPDYTITGAGSIGFDRSTRWNGLIELSPRLTQEVQRDYRIIRYLLDRRGRLAIPFHIEGQVPNVTVRLENRALAQALRTGGGQKSEAADGQGSEGNKERRKWLPGALERFLNR
jgi:autotransporter translocation and assembly factor TamB